MSETVKLNDRHRRQILTNLLNARFAQQEAALQQELDALGEKIYDVAFDTLEQVKMASLPHHYLPTVKYIKARLGNTDHEFTLLTPRRVPFVNLHHSDHAGHVIVLPDGHPLAKVFLDNRNIYQRIQDEKQELKKEIYAVLLSVTTSNKLVATWPEIRAVVESVCNTTSTANLPAPRVDHLNKVLGLKVA